MISEKRGRGYIGRSMSVNAKNTYSSNCKPMSKWRKSDFIEEANNFLDINIKSISGSYKNYLKYDSWHHTGYFYNQTEFYQIDYEKIEQAIKDGEIILYTDMEIVEIEKREQLEQEKKLQKWAEYEKLEAEKNQAIEIELLQARKTTRTSKKGNIITVLEITDSQPLLQQALINGEYIPKQDYAKFLGIEKHFEFIVK